MNLLLRKIIHRCLPVGTVQALRRWHAPRVARRFGDADWAYAELVKSWIQPGDTVIDVGANMGYITVRLAEYVGTTGTVIAIEPVPDTFDLLQQTVRALSLHQVRPLCACASGQAGTVALEIPSDPAGGENLYESSVVDPARPSCGRRVTAPAITLDSLFDIQDLPPPSFIKIDVEGHEWDVVRGGYKILQSHHPALLIEVSGDPDEQGGTARKLFDDLSDFGYVAYMLENNSLRPRQPGDQVVDYVFLRPDG